MGKVFPTIAAPGIFFDAAEWPQAPGGGQGKGFPTVAAPGCPPDHQKYRWDPPISYAGYVSIYGIPGDPI